MNWGTFSDLFLHTSDEPLVFHTGFFLFIFSLFLIGYAYVSKTIHARNIYITVFSFYFYYMTSGMFLILLILTITVDYAFAQLMVRQRNEILRKALLCVGILFSLSFLFYFKYRNFFLENTNWLFGTHFEITQLLLPIGISFYTFQSISFLVDTYKKKIAMPSYGEYLMFMSFFPHLIAGPIVRSSDFLPQAAGPVTVTRENMNEGFYMILKGLIKKAIISDFIAQYADTVFGQPDAFTGTESIFATLCYTFQIFFDFSGYTDMAIGIALLLGFRLGINFLSPYKAINITDFWRRWHISLSSWLRDYIYIPMGGNASGFQLQLLFILLTMLIGGFWHGADWKFVFWGGMHGLLLVLHKLYMKYVKFNDGFLKPLYWLLTFACVALLWIPFRATSMDDAIIIYKSVFSGASLQMADLIIDNNPLLVIVFSIGVILALLPS
ncbi:MAG TPA: MBOAT family O-acyltransferase, partial [Bacteroidia bacterium]|nr:MBOAT family O-acyltransferase [Bacteroidia bacterium]